MSEENKEIIDSENNEEVVDTEPTDGESTIDDSKDELSDREKQFLARAKKAESKLKATKEAVSDDEPKEINKTKPTVHSTSEQVQREVFLATGGTLEELEVLDTIVGDSLQVKKESALYKAYVAQDDSNKRDKKASIGTSKGGRTIAAKKQTREEHKAETERRASELMGQR